MKKILATGILLFQVFNSNSQLVTDNLTWVSPSSVQSAVSPSFNFCNGQVAYTITSTIGFKNVSTAGNPSYSIGMITPAYIYDPSFNIPVTITFSQPVCNLRIRFCDLDLDEQMNSISPAYVGLTNVFGSFSNPGTSTQITSGLDNSIGWVDWDVPVTTLSFIYNRPGPGHGLIIDSILFDCCAPPCQAPNPGTNNTLSICSQGVPTDLFPLLGSGASTSNGTWTNPAGTVVTMPYDPLTMNPGIYTYSVDSNGCSSSATITVTEINPTVSVVTTDPTCHGMSNGSAVLTVTDATIYSLNGGPNVPVPSPFVVNGLAAGTYQIVVYHVSGCTDSESFTINDPPVSQPLITSISQNFVACSGDVSTVTATGSGGSLPYTFTWFTNSGIVGTGTTINVITNQTTQYGVILTDACGSISDTAFVTIVVPQPLNPILTPDNTVGCFPHHVIFSNNTGGPGNIVTSTINFGDETPTITTNALDTCSHTYESSGSYTVSITSVSDSGCVYSSTFTNMIVVYGSPTADFNISPNPTTFFDTHILLHNTSSTDVVSYNWSIPGAVPNQSFSEDLSIDLPEGIVGNYPVTLVVTNANGCKDSMTKIAQVLSDVILYAPNTFTPDGDEFNQTWSLSIDGIDIYHFNLKVFDRWGEVIWESNDPKASWDGTYQGRIVPNDQYIWILETKEFISDKKYNFNGYINVMR